MDQYIADGLSMEMDMAEDEAAYNEETLDNILAHAKDIIEEQKLIIEISLNLQFKSKKLESLQSELQTILIQSQVHLKKRNSIPIDLINTLASDIENMKSEKTQQLENLNYLLKSVNAKTKQQLSELGEEFWSDKDIVAISKEIQTSDYIIGYAEAASMDSNTDAQIPQEVGNALSVQSIVGFLESHMASELGKTKSQEQTHGIPNDVIMNEKGRKMEDDR